MPRYEFICDECKEKFDIFLTVKEFDKMKDQPHPCPQCGKLLRYSFSSPLIKWNTSGGTGASL